MRAVVQRVASARVTVEGAVTGEIGPGLLVLLGVGREDTSEDVAWLAAKVAALRIFEDKTGRMNRAVTETGGGILVVSQFTLYASTKKGNRPSFIEASRPEHAIPLYEEMTKQLIFKLTKPIQTGVFGADMKVSLINDGPVTIIIDSKNPS